MRLGPHHFAHLRAIAEGLPLVDAAKRYLGVEHAAAAAGAHRRVVDQLRALARRAGDSRWRLIGLEIGRAAAAAGEQPPSLDDWAAERGLDGWSQAELQEMYAEAFPPNRRAARGQRLRRRQLEVLRELERTAATPAAASDPLAAWFDEATAERLRQAGLLMLGDLQERIASRTRWWTGLPAIGQAKAERIRAVLEQLLPPRPRQRLASALEATSRALADPLPPSAPSPPPPGGLLPAATGEHAPALPAAPPSALPFPSGAQAIAAWIRARAGSTATARAYSLQAERLLLWLRIERGGRGLRDMDADDCRAYLAFLAHVPPRWISRRGAPKGGPDWTPFAGPLSVASQRQAVAVVRALYEWLLRAGYVLRSPWALVNAHIGDEADTAQPLTAWSGASRAFSPRVWAAITGYANELPPSPAAARLRFLLAFGESTGLRADELVSAKLGHIETDADDRCWLRVVGKGAKARAVYLPAQALQALDAYLSARGLPSLDDARGEQAEQLAGVPLLASVEDPMQPVGYQALYQALRRAIRAAVDAAADLSPTERRRALAASPHSLRHTYGTRAVERGVPLDVLQRSMGHARPDTTAQYSRAQEHRISTELERAFG